MHDAERRMRDFERWHRRPAPRSAEAWEASTPAELRDQCTLAGFAAGVLTVVVPSASVTYALDRALRAGLETTLREATGGKLVRVRSRVGAGPA